MSDTRRQARRKGSLPDVETIIVAVGLLAAVIGGVIAYQAVGLYGDGPFSFGYRRTRDVVTGKSLLVHETRTSTGVIRRVIDERTLKEVWIDADADGRQERVLVDGTQVTRVDRDHDGDGRVDVSEYYDATQQLVKAGLSLANDGVVDAWAYRSSDGTLIKIDVSTKRDNLVDRWEYYESGQLARVEEDKDRDGRVDRWLTYDAGILMDTAVDDDKDGRPDSPAIQ